MTILVLASFALFLFPFTVIAQTPPSSALHVPSSLKTEHDDLHRELKGVIELGGRTGIAARAVAAALHAHFEAEEEFAMPQLSLLAAAAAGDYPNGSERAIELSARLRTELPHMLAEHKVVVEKLEALIHAAKSEKKTEAIRFAERLKLHALNEEEILYPAGILVGQQLARNHK